MIMIKMYEVFFILIQDYRINKINRIKQVNGGIGGKGIGKILKNI